MVSGSNLIKFYYGGSSLAGPFSQGPSFVAAPWGSAPIPVSRGAARPNPESAWETPRKVRGVSQAAPAASRAQLG